MSTFQKHDLETLLAEKAGPHVSIYLPLTAAGDRFQQNPVQLKVLLTEAEQKLIEAGMRPADARQMLQAPAELIHDRLFWKQPGEGLALFCTPGMLRYWRLPMSFEAAVWAGARFHLRPLLPLVGGDDRFYVVAVSEKMTAFYAGTRAGVTEVAAPEMPKSLDEALGYDVREGAYQVHSGNPNLRQAHGRKEAGVFTGQGGLPDQRKTEQLAYLRAIDRSLHGLLHNHREPLIFCGVEPLFALYQQVNSYPQLHERCLAGSPWLLSPQELHRAATALLEPEWDQTRRQAAAAYPQFARAGRAVSDIEQLVTAADEGAVETLLLSSREPVWGRVEPNGAVMVRAERMVGDEDLLERAAVATVAHGGAVYEAGPDRLPVDAPAVGLLRRAISTVAGSGVS